MYYPDIDPENDVVYSSFQWAKINRIYCNSNPNVIMQCYSFSSHIFPDASLIRSFDVKCVEH